MTSIAGKIRAFVDTRVIPHEHALVQPSADPAQPYRETELFEGLRAEARALGLWVLQHENGGAGPARSHADFFPLAVETGRSRLAPLLMNSTGPDSGNMDLLRSYGTPAQQGAWLGPLESGDIRSCFAMTEPAVASSDARNITAEIVQEGDSLRITGRKWWITQAAHPDCRIALVVGRLRAPGETYDGRHTIVLMPLDTPGVRVERRLTVFGYLEDHAELVLDDVVVPIENILGPPGEGLTIAQERLIGARLHHCMRMVGVAERALEVMVERSRSRTAFGSRLDGYDTVRDAVAESRIDIETMRSLVARAAELADAEGLPAASTLVSMVKVLVPRTTVQVVDRAIQVCGGGGVSDDLPLATFFTHARTLRIADGPDDVHKMVIARAEMGRRPSRV
ncbi:acyl-CoA dehydrogenase [Intrasporangium chromatireducens Q5-1]|uniref:Acyl-CoA dehydrogenase n=1 Tax=Intrasporangium chromatireducens Q5-1 TaxID=584657 RepID=W9GGF9_9MICO|nr:acyl-CoA dehydrogenase family protein [Intrasporangium chromatireducens]EWT05321.1 acyl-CoA dehydrogenase [Intrasporangium chromatireducens Q5-1]